MKHAYLEKVIEKLTAQFDGQSEYIQAIEELTTYMKLSDAQWELVTQDNILERLMLPDRIIQFNVAWVDDSDQVHVNQGWRVQHANLIGPYKGGLRFHPNVSESTFKFLALEQTFKNAITGLPIGGAKGGANFDPKGKSDREVMRFCHAFMDELHRHIGATTDIPAGDINVGQREIGYLFGRHRRLQNQFTGALTGKNVEFGGSQVRTESTGYGAIFFVQRALEKHDKSLEGQDICISGAGNVALHAAKKAIECGANVLTLSNSKGSLYRESGISLDTVNGLLERGRNAKLDEQEGEWLDSQKPWGIPCKIAIPCATQNEVDSQDASSLIENKVEWLFEGANMPCTASAITTLREANVNFAPAKAVNSGGVAVSLFEMEQNAAFSPQSFDELEKRLTKTMRDIHDNCWHAGDGDYLVGANNFAFQRLIHAMSAQGI
ncbi:NADP-specific glutamate dehydrogenase [Thalassotalea euphylliae]|uniref:NADP-specific glutamate dehydrogenase n=1 Tax=Thalassotalea euphylliae TaxID=1655234 RepID=UPI0036282D99